MLEKPARIVYSREHAAAHAPEVRQLTQEYFHTNEEGFRGRMRIH
jgi:hypothetical protein